MEKKGITNKKYKDTVFRMLFNNKKEALGLYNNLFNVSYTDESLVDIVTLENVLFTSRKNDIAFTIDGRFVVLYNGHDNLVKNGDVVTELELDLSDAFRDCSDTQLELKVRVIDIRYSSHNKVVARNDTLGQYSRFIQIVDDCKNIEWNLDEAMKMAVNMAIENNILTDFLKQHSSEVRNMITL